jgi:hypothetical protein
LGVDDHGDDRVYSHATVRFKEKDFKMTTSTVPDPMETTASTGIAAAQEFRLSGVNEVSEVEPKVLGHDPRAVSRRFRFVAVDINPMHKATERPMVVREHDGTLREATKMERLQHFREYPESGIPEHYWDI